MAIYNHDASGNPTKIASTNVTGDTLPVGIMGPWPSDTIPDNWLLCNGQAVSRTEYADLFAVLGTSHGVGDGSTTFNVPDMRDYTVVGKSSTDTNIDTIGKKYGAKTHTLKINEMPSHNHSIRSGEEGTEVHNEYGPISTSNKNKYQILSLYSGGGQAHNNMQPSIAENYIIKAKQSSGVVATVVDNLTSTSATDALSANMGKVLKELIDLIKPTILYNNSTGTTGTVTLSETSANFSTIKIFYMSSGGGYNSVEVYQPNGKRVYLITNAVDSGVSYIQNKLVEINGTSITNVAYNQNSVGTGSVSSSNDNNNHIVRVVGYK